MSAADRRKYRRPHIADDGMDYDDRDAEITRLRDENARLIAALNLITAHYDASDRQIALAEAALAAKESHP